MGEWLQAKTIDMTHLKRAYRVGQSGRGLSHALSHLLERNGPTMKFIEHKPGRPRGDLVWLKVLFFVKMLVNKGDVDSFGYRHHFERGHDLFDYLNGAGTAGNTTVTDKSDGFVLPFMDKII